MERTLERSLSQDNVRAILQKEFNVVNETFLKYVYDGYTYRGNYKAIRKPKTRKRIALDFHQQELSKKYAQDIVNYLLKEEAI